MSMNARLAQKLHDLPRSPGVYLHKDASGEVIYVGKAAVLRNRVRQYFQVSRLRDAKTDALVADITDTDWIETESEVDALFLESELIKRYKPRWNILLRDDTASSYVRIDMKNEWPTVTYTRTPADDGAEYIGPFYSTSALRKALRVLRRVYPYLTKQRRPGDSRLEEDLGLSPKRSLGSAAYKRDLRNLMRYIRGQRPRLVQEMTREMKQLAADQQFEQAAAVRNKLRALDELQRRVMFGDKEFLAISSDQALVDIAELLGLPGPPRRIEGYDISHMSGTNVVASMVVFTNGVSNRSEYRKFKTKKEHNNDFFNMHETISRRLTQKNTNSWGIPDLMLIDGGKGQLDAALRARDEQAATQQRSYQGIPFIGIAKKEEQIVIAHDRSQVQLNKQKLQHMGGYITVTRDFTLVNLPHTTHLIKLLQRIRDESHRFAVSYHTVLKRQRATQGALEEIPGIGPKSRQELLRRFGSVRGVRRASLEDLIAAVGAKRAALVRQHLPPL